MLTSGSAASDIDATVQILSVLEMAKDSTALLQLKESLSEVKEQIKVNDERLASIVTATAALDQTKSDITAAQLIVDQRIAKADTDISNVAKGFADLEAARDAAKDERNAEDARVAAIREELTAREARVVADAAQIILDRDALEIRAIQIDVEIGNAKTAQAAANDLRAQYEESFAALQKLVTPRPV
jgi:chromosome segregation ATPase